MNVWKNVVTERWSWRVKPPSCAKLIPLITIYNIYIYIVYMLVKINFFIMSLPFIVAWANSTATCQLSTMSICHSSKSDKVKWQVIDASALSLVCVVPVNYSAPVWSCYPTNCLAMNAWIYSGLIYGYEFVLNEIAHS